MGPYQVMGIRQHREEDTIVFDSYTVYAPVARLCRSGRPLLRRLDFWGRVLTFRLH